MFGLGEEIGGDELGVGGIIGEDEDLAGAGEKIDGDIAEEEAFGGDDIGVAGAEHLLDAADGSGAECEGGDGLGAADAMDLGGAGGGGGEKEGGIDGSVLAARGGDDDLGTAGGLGQGDGHQGGGDQGCGAAGDVDADALEGVELFTDRGAVMISALPVLAEGTAGELGDIAMGIIDGGAEGGIGLIDGLLDFLRGNAKGGGGEACAVESFGEFDEGGIAFGSDGLDDGAGAFLDGGIEQA